MRLNYRQVRILRVEMEHYAHDNNLSPYEVVATMDEPTAVHLCDSYWDAREMKGAHKDDTPKVHTISL